MLWGVLGKVASWWRRRGALGPRGERAAARHLRSRGYRILARNLRTRIGEIDLLAEDPQRRFVVVVEVKSAAGDAVAPERHVDRRKQRKLTALAAQLLRRPALRGRRIRFDVVAIVWPDGERAPTRLTHYPGAFESSI